MRTNDYNWRSVHACVREEPEEHPAEESLASYEDRRFGSNDLKSEEPVRQSQNDQHQLPEGNQKGENLLNFKQQDTLRLFVNKVSFSM